ncbi:hypothetical protein L6R52_08970 [Myxococcota bacterium]|nr:hypothetical protein [Myxococcota bacterium]
MISVRTALQRCASITALGALVVASAPAPAAASEPFPIAGMRDEWSLLPRHPVNLLLFEQLDDEPRLGPGLLTEGLAFVADLSVRSVQPSPRAVRFHGMFIADLYLAARLLDGFDANLNLALFTPSASDAYRSFAQVSPGLALHAWGSPLRLGGSRLHLDLVATDLGWITTGAGLLVEQTPLEGILFRMRWREHELRWLFGGRVLWQDDDLLDFSLRLFDGALALDVVGWLIDYDLTSDLLVAQATGRSLGTNVAPPGPDAWYATATLDLPLSDALRVAFEGGARIAGDVRPALVARVDHVLRASRFSTHVGYQARWYARGFGPRNAAIPASLPFNLPRREDTYATNGFELLTLSPAFEQWSHTAMLELRVRPIDHLELFADGELWLRFARGGDGKVLVAPDGFVAPGRRLDAYYRVGASLLPWPEHPVRLQTFVTNKHTESGELASTEVRRRFLATTAHNIALQLEVKL